MTSVTSGVSLNFDSFVSYRCVIMFGLFNFPGQLERATE